MWSVLKWIGISIGVITVILIVALSLMIYKVKYGFPFYDKTPPSLQLEKEEITVLLYTKANGFVHEEGIAAGEKMFQKIANKNGWKLVISENGALFNKEQLPYFDVVIWNNVTGRTLNSEQQIAFKKYMEEGGNFIGIHGTGDDSHHWPWYYEELIGAHFSHHSMNPQMQIGTMKRECSDSFISCSKLPETWNQEEEWYVFFDNPRDLGATILYTVDESNLVTNGNVPYLVRDKDFGMGDHPVIWYRCLQGGGKSFYSALGHGAKTFENITFEKIMVNAIGWASDPLIECK